MNQIAAHESDLLSTRQSTEGYWPTAKHKAKSWILESMKSVNKLAKAKWTNISPNFIIWKKSHLEFRHAVEIFKKGEVTHSCKYSKPSNEAEKRVAGGHHAVVAVFVNRINDVWAWRQIISMEIKQYINIY